MRTSAAVVYGQRNMRGAGKTLEFPFARVIHDQSASDLCKPSVDDVSMDHCGFKTHCAKNYDIHIRLLPERTTVHY